MEVAVQINSININACSLLSSAIASIVNQADSKEKKV